MNDQSHYGIFLNYFGTHHTFQTFCDKGINKKLIKQLHGTIEEHLKTILYKSIMHVKLLIDIKQ